MSQKQVKRKKEQRHQERIAAKMKRKRMQMMVVVTICIVILAAAGVWLLAGHSSGDNEATNGNHGNGKTSQKTSQSVDLDYDQQPMLGEADAPVKIVEFGDFKCPVCKSFDEVVFPKIKKNLIETGKASYYFLNYPIIPGSLPAELAAESVYHRAGNDAYWEYHETLYENQQDEHKNWATTDYLVQLAKKYVPEVDTEQLKKDIDAQTYLKQVKADHRRGVDLGMTGTPTLFVNGEMVGSRDKVPNYNQVLDAVEQAVESGGK